MDTEQQLLTAVAERKLKLVKLLLDGGVNIESRGYDGRTPLIVAFSFVGETGSEENRFEIVCILLERGADPNAKDIRGRTALMFAFRHHVLPELVHLLLKHRADPLISDERGRNAFEFLKANYLYLYKSSITKYCPSAVKSIHDSKCKLTLSTQEKKQKACYKQHVLLQRSISDSTQVIEKSEENITARRSASFSARRRVSLNPSLETIQELNTQFSDIISNDLNNYVDDIRRATASKHDNLCYMKSTVNGRKEKRRVVSTTDIETYINVNNVFSRQRLPPIR